MSFVCNGCHQFYQGRPHFVQSYGPCEDCGMVQLTADCHCAVSRIESDHSELQARRKGARDRRIAHHNDTLQRIAENGSAWREAVDSPWAGKATS